MGVGSTLLPLLHMCAILSITRLHKTVRRKSQGRRTCRALSVGATRQRLDMGVSRERELATCERRSDASEAQICMRARARRLVVLLVSIKTPFRTSVERWNDSRTPVSLDRGVSAKSPSRTTNPSEDLNAPHCAPLRSAEAPAHAPCWRTRFPIPRTVYHHRSSLSDPAHLRYQHHPTQHPCPNCPNCPNGKLFFKY